MAGSSSYSSTSLSSLSPSSPRLRGSDLALAARAVTGDKSADEVGRCRSNQVDPYPITYSLSNP
jgi:hypothetical protein